MKVIFLDFDGVLQIGKHDNPWKGRTVDKVEYTNCDEYGFYFDAGCVGRLKQLIAQTNAGVVISSAWRFEGERIMRELLEDRNMPGELYAIIPFEGHEMIDDFNAFSRGDCILQWQMQHGSSSYVILDDVDDFRSSQKKFFIQTTFEIGFSEVDLKKAITILNK